MRKLFLLGALLLCGAVGASAQVTLDARSADGAVLASFPVNTATSVSFRDGAVTVTNGDNSESISFGTFDNLGFGTESTAIKEVAKKSAKLSVTPWPVVSSMAVEGLDTDRPSLLTVYDISGRRVVVRDNYQGESLDVSHLPSGIYLVNVANQTIRFIKK